MSRPRNDHFVPAALDYASSMLIESGYDALTMDAVAAAVGVAKTTVYRRWPTKEHLIVAVLADWHTEIPVPDTGTVEGDLTALASGMVAGLDPTPMRRLVAELVAASARDSSFRSLVTDLWASRREACLVILRRGVERSELRPDLDPLLVLDNVAGSLYYRVLITAEPLDEHYVARLTQGVLDGIRPRTGR